MTGPGPVSAGHLVLGTWLRHLRVECGLTGGQAAAELVRDGAVSLSVPVLSRIETGQRSVNSGEADALLRIYRCGPTESSTRAWRQLGDTTVAVDGQAEYPVADTVAGWQDRLAAVEHRARRARYYSQFLIPAFLRTDAYAAQVAGAGPQPQIARPHVVGASTAPLVVLDASLLSRPWGGDDLFNAQVQHLLNAMATGRCDLRVLPTDRDVHLPAHHVTEYHLERGIRLHAVERSDGVTYYGGRENGLWLSDHLDRAAARSLGPGDSRRHLERALTAASKAGLPPPG
ncbi:Scr1 family TA system antitoxin-like transcriptional regulator [Streptomyces anulatus]